MILSTGEMSIKVPYAFKIAVLLGVFTLNAATKHSMDSSYCTTRPRYVDGCRILCSESILIHLFFRKKNSYSDLLFEQPFGIIVGL
jgi:hypothetical protein